MPWTEILIAWLIASVPVGIVVGKLIKWGLK